MFKRLRNKRIRNMNRIKSIRSRPFIKYTNQHNSMPYLIKGTTGKEVEELQEMLQELSNIFPSLPVVTIDGYYGDVTQDTVKKFQSLNSIPTTGEVDDITWDKIKDFLNNRNQNIPINITTDDIDLSDNVIRIGSKGKYVSDLQTYLNIAANKYPSVSKVKVDGIFGQNTQQSVLEFQRQVGLNTDGVVGVQTWNALYDVSTNEPVSNEDE